jgi:hypothetical protein
MKTLALDNTNWDLGLDDVGNIATKEGNNQISQDVASSVRVFKGECPFDTDRGVAYNEPDLIRETLMFDMNNEAKRIKGVADSTVVFNQLENRKLSTTIYIETESGDKINVG